MDPGATLTLVNVSVYSFDNNDRAEQVTKYNGCVKVCWKAVITIIIKIIKIRYIDYVAQPNLSMIRDFSDAATL